MLPIQRTGIAAVAFYEEETAGGADRARHQLTAFTAEKYLAR
jgi:hypothetical protein